MSTSYGWPMMNRCPTCGWNMVSQPVDDLLPSSEPDKMLTYCVNTPCPQYNVQYKAPLIAFELTAVEPPASA